MPSRTIQRAGHAARRVRQTLTSFDGGARLLGDIARRRVTGGPAELVFRTPDQVEIICPNLPGARVPVYEVFAEDTYRMEWFLAGVREEPVAIDIGAHIGCFSVDFAHRHPQGRADSYEASSATADYLERNIATNGLGARVTAHRTAIAAEEGFIEFADNAGGSSLNGLTAPDGTPTTKVPSIRIAQAIANAGDRVDVVKIDTEGAEYDFILASSPVDWAPVDRVVMEYHHVPGRDRAELTDFFAAAGLPERAHEVATPREGTLWLSRT